ncbi:exopolyphosphatase [Rhodococcus sp. 1163]|uniref:acyclic terpene utilization AtuA family protein n=1 Tax=Rhodococcus sp. 1163 TaxID=1905289 RepID=UPI0009FDCF57|nr:acyclic terpene utilization AtuA family protein [Rhodococcus sp. 1163]ORI17793.1 exopolyphosphatase [Rhodococcus sp. 1163]
MTVRIGNCSGFYGDRLSAMREMLEGGELDYLTGDYLAELTMLILGRDRAKDQSRGYAKTFLRQAEDCLGLALDKGVKIVSNAGGLNPSGLVEALDKLGTGAEIAYVHGDDLLPRAQELGLGSPLTANAYLGAWGIVEALNAGADVVVTGRVTDASVIVGPAAAHFGWSRTDYDALAGAVVAGHIIECGTQATGGNYSFFTEIADMSRPGFPIAEIEADGSSVITKHEGTSGAVSVGTVTAQLLYEITGGRYANPDATARIDTASVSQVGADRVLVSGVKGEAPPPTAKVSLNALGGFRNEFTLILTGLDIEAKAALAQQQFESWLPSRPTELDWTLVRTDKPDAETEETASALLRCVVRDSDPNVVERQFSSVAVELALASYPGLSVTAPPGNGAPYGVFTAGYVPIGEVPHVVVLPDGTQRGIEPATETLELEPLTEPDLPPVRETEPTIRVPLGTIAAARSGDKGGNANVGVWVRTDDEFAWLAHALTVEQVALMLPETADLVVTRHVLPKLRAVNFVIEGILGEGVASQARFDPQAKGLGEWLRSRHIDIPETLVFTGTLS